MGTIELTKIDWNKGQQNYSKLYEYHNSRIKCISGYIKYVAEVPSCFGKSLISCSFVASSRRAVRQITLRFGMKNSIILLKSSR